jgi:hypothetical protein
LLLSGKFRAVPKPSRKTVCNVFYGYQAEEIMRVCDVSKATAQHFKRGSRLPSPQAQKLWRLHREGRILGPEWSRFRVHKDALIDEAGNRFEVGEIASLALIHQQIAELRLQLDKRRYAEEVGELGFFELSESLQGLIQRGSELLKAVEKIPRRRPNHVNPDGVEAKVEEILRLVTRR